MTEMKKHIYNESNGLWYEHIGDYYIPVLTLSSEEQRPIGTWGRILLRSTTRFIASRCLK